MVHRALRNLRQFLLIANEALSSLCILFQIAVKNFALLAFASVLYQTHDSICNFPVVRSSPVCSMQLATSAAVTLFSPCSVPFVSTLNPWCEEAAVVDKESGSVSSELLMEQFSLFSHLFNQSVLNSNSYHGYEVCETVMNLEDLSMLVKRSAHNHRDALVFELDQLRRASRLSSRNVQAYSIRLQSSISLIYTSARHTIDLSESLSLPGQPSVWTSFCTFLKICTSPKLAHQKHHESYLHTLKTFESLNRELFHLNSLTMGSLTSMEGHSQNIAQLISDKTLDAQADLGEVLGRLWTRFGGHRAAVFGAEDRLSSLLLAGSHVLQMKMLVWDAQTRLEATHARTEALHSQAAEPLLIESNVPANVVLRSLVEGCQALEAMVFREEEFSPSRTAFKFLGN